MTVHLATVETPGDQLLVAQAQVADAAQRRQGSPSLFASRTEWRSELHPITAEQAS